MVFSNLSL